MAGFFDDTEEMTPMFYVGALVILATVIANGIVKSYKKVTTN